MTNLPSIKRGSSLVLNVDIGDTTAAAAELKSQVRDGAGKLISDLVITAAEPPGVFKFVCQDTTAWPNNAYMDVKRTKDGMVSYSETINITVVEGVTK